LIVDLKELKPLENALKRTTPQSAVADSARITLDRICERVNLLALKLAEVLDIVAAASAETVEKKKEVKDEDV
jgi:hypothetical protein